MPSQNWTVPRSWPGEEVFILAGGPSAALLDLSALRDRHVIAVNSAWALVPFAEYLFFNDKRWWTEYQRDLARFRGRIVTTARGLRHPHLLNVGKRLPKQFDPTDRQAVAMQTTSLAGAINLGLLLNGLTAPVYLLGADGKLGADGRRHAHEVVYPWELQNRSYRRHAAELMSLVPCYSKAGAKVINGNPSSAYRMFPFVDAAEMLGHAKESGPMHKFPSDRAAEAYTWFVSDVLPGPAGAAPAVLDIGAGLGEHARAMAADGLRVTTVDIGPKVEGVYLSIERNFLDEDVLPARGNGGEFDGIWASHVLEHQTDVGAFLRKARRLLKPGGVLAVTVPPLKEKIVGGHLTLWNAGLLLYNLVLAGFDCSQARVGTYGYNVSVIVRRKDAALPTLRYDRGDIEALASFFPVPVEQGFDGRLANVRW